MAKPALLAAVPLIAAVLSAPGALAAEDATVHSAFVSPKRGFTDSVGGVRIAFRLGGSVPADVAIRIEGASGEVRSIDVPQVPPGEDLVERWDGLTNGGRAVADGRYRVIVGVA